MTLLNLWFCRLLYVVPIPFRFVWKFCSGNLRSVYRTSTSPANALPAKKSRLHMCMKSAALAGLCGFFVILTSHVLSGQARSSATLKLDTGEQIYKAACVACHGLDGSGAPQTLTAFERPDTFP